MSTNSPTGTGLIGQVGAKPGSSVAGSITPPRPSLIGYRETGIEIRPHRVAFAYFAAWAVLGYGLGRLIEYVLAGTH